MPWSRPPGRLASTEAGTSGRQLLRLVCIENVHGTAGCNDLGASLGLWAPKEEGKDFDLSLE